MLMDKIRADMIQARQTGSGVAKSLLVTLFAEASRVGKDKRNGDTTDEECVAVVRKFIANAEETRKLLLDRGQDESAQLEEIALLNVYMPQQMTADQLRAVILDLINKQGLQGPKAMGQIMAALKANYNGQYDGKMASDTVKQILG